MSAEKGKTREVVFDGLGVSSGIAVGAAHVRETGVVDIPEYTIKKREVAGEEERLTRAVDLAQRQVRRLQYRAKSMKGAAAEELGFLLDAYLHMLEDSRLVRGAKRRIGGQRINAEAAVTREIADISDTFQTMDDAYIAARLDDIREVGNRVLINLTKNPARRLSPPPADSIIIADTLSPADMAQIDPGQVAGVGTMLGGAEGHTAIMARALELPAVLGAHGLMDGVRSGDTVVIDGSKGRIVVNPEARTLRTYKARREKMVREAKALEHMRSRPARSRDGTEFQLQANVELSMELEAVQRAGAEGIGLLRSEFLYMNRADVPDADEQFRMLKGIVESMDGRPVTVRTLDLGGEKAADGILGDIDEGVASALGLRGIRLSLDREDLLDAQFKAILRAGTLGPVRILLPMVSAVSEVRRARKLLEKAATKLKRAKVPVPDPLPPLGVMIEVPGAALAADALAGVSDFLAVGSNDLTMYTLAVDRANEHVAGLFNPLHPAVLRLIQFTTAAAHRAGIPISICGEMAGDPRLTAVLAGLGLRELSMSPGNIPRVKQRIREMDAVAATVRANLIMEQTDAGRIATLLDDFNALA